MKEKIVFCWSGGKTGWEALAEDWQGKAATPEANSGATAEGVANSPESDYSLKIENLRKAPPKPGQQQLL